MRAKEFIVENAGGVIAYHGSSHLINRFNLSSVGSGISGNVLGWGIYFAELDQAADTFRRLMVDQANAGLVAKIKSIFKIPHKGYLYTVRFNCAREDFINARMQPNQQGKWNDLCAELTHLPPLANRGMIDFFKKTDPSLVLYHQLSQKLGSDKAASLELAKRGVKGLIVEGQNSGGDYYVIFDDSIIEIIDAKEFQ